MEPEVLRVASRVVWWAPPEAVVSRLDDFLCRVMALANLADARFIEARFGAARLQAALRAAPHGVVDARSWHYWHQRLGLGPAGPLPTRRFP